MFENMVVPEFKTTPLFEYLKYEVKVYHFVNFLLQADAKFFHFMCVPLCQKPTLLLGQRTLTLFPNYIYSN